MLKLTYVLAATGVIALLTGVPVAGEVAGAAAETRVMLLTATAFFGLAFVVRSRSKRPPRQ